MGSNKFSFQVYSKSFKSVGHDGWQQASVTVNEDRRLICLNWEQASSESSSVGSNPSGQAPRQVNSDYDYTIPLSDFRAPKEKTKKFPDGFTVEVRSRMPIGSRCFLFHSRSRSDMDAFMELLRRVWPRAQRRPSVTRSGDAVEVVVAARQHQQQPLDARFCGGDYATVTNGGSIVFDGDSEFVNIQSDIYEAFESNCCFCAFVNSYEGRYEAPDRLGITKGDKIYLYTAFNQLELLSKEKRFLCSWPYTQIKCFSHSCNIVRVEFGTRTCTGRATVGFRFEAIGPDASVLDTEANSFVARLCAAVKTPPRCQYCAGGGCFAGGRRAAAAADTDDDDDDDEDEDPAATSAAAAAAAPTADVYETVRRDNNGNNDSSSNNNGNNNDGQQSSSKPRQPPPRPPLPPHPSISIEEPQQEQQNQQNQRPTPPPTMPKPPLEMRRRFSSPTASQATSTVALESLPPQTQTQPQSPSPPSQRPPPPPLPMAADVNVDCDYADITMPTEDDESEPVPEQPDELWNV